MAMDFRIKGDFTFEMGVLFPRQVLAVVQVVLIVNQALASPVWMPQFLTGDASTSAGAALSRSVAGATPLPSGGRLSRGKVKAGVSQTPEEREFLRSWPLWCGAGTCEEDSETEQYRSRRSKATPCPGHGRNIRHLPCVSRRSGEQGICMFAYTCMKSNGTHLGTCIDRFYFGSCCKLKDTTNDLLLDNHLNFPLIATNQVSSPPVYPPSSTLNISSLNTPSTTPHPPPASDDTIVDLAQHLATETYFLTPTTDRIYVPIYTSHGPNKTDIFSSASAVFTTTHGSTSSAFTHVKRPTTQNPTLYQSTHSSTPATTHSYLLSTFQLVHNDANNTSAPDRITSPANYDTTTAPPNKNATLTPTSKPPTTTTPNKPNKPLKPLTTTRKPPTKKPSPKPTIRPAAPTTTKPTSPVKKPVSTIPLHKHTTPKPPLPVKKPTQPTKKPGLSSPKPTTKPTASSTKPSSAVKPTTPKPTTASPIFTALLQTTSEVVFTKPGTTFSSSPPTKFGITTFRPDLSPPTTKPDLITGPYLTTFNYVSGGVKETTPRPDTTAPAEGSSSTIGNDSSSSSSPSSSSEAILPNLQEAQGENANIIFQQAGSTTHPGSQKPGDGSIPFFPEATKPAPSKPPWIQIVQTTSTTDSTVTTTTKTSSTTGSSSTHVAIFAGLNSSDYTQVCGRRLFPESRVVGGEKSSFGKWPWQISLRQWRTSTYLHKCGAALLNENWAITAAHCVENVPPSDLLLRLGEHDLSTEDEPYGFQERRVQIVASHPQFDPRTFEYDLALLRFYEPVKFQPNIIPVCVPEDSTNFVGQTAYVTGWGRLYEDGPLPSVLQEVSVPVINNTLCENMYRSAGYIEHIPEIFICAGWKKGGFDSCEGDSGGPMVIQRPDKRWLLAGVISWGIGCAEPNQPGVYTRISEFREWIQQILQF